MKEELCGGRTLDVDQDSVCEEDCSQEIVIRDMTFIPCTLFVGPFGLLLLRECGHTWNQR